MYIYILSIKYNNATQYNPSLFHTLHNTVYIYTIIQCITQHKI